MKIRRPEKKRYHEADISQYLKLPKGSKYPKWHTVYTDTFQDWFHEGVRECTDHPYPYRWHIMAQTTCPQCDPLPEKTPKKKIKEDLLKRLNEH